jgi:hypothetical protein
MNNKYVFFVTNDYSLFYASKSLMEEGRIRRPLSVTSEVLLQALTFVRPLGKIEGTSLEAFKEFLTQTLYAKLRPISMNKLLSVAYPWLKEEYLTLEDLEDIISTRFIEEYLTKPQEEKVGMYTVTFEETIPRIIDRKVGQKIKKLEERITQLESEKKQLEEKYLKIVKTPIKIKPLFFIGIATFLVFISFAILSGLKILTLPDTIYYCLTIIIVSFIGSSIFGKKILGVFKLLSKK